MAKEYILFASYDELFNYKSICSFGRSSGVCDIVVDTREGCGRFGAAALAALMLVASLAIADGGGGGGGKFGAGCGSVGGSV
ncbi:Hypothetical predicted protein [Octopus vulgaris]|uniref:Uncharacterized protein n=1 Tax=Octopus vulgaris TaxID=6645 RepID=A0AA36BR25_OCTVU|nr:Hypothetical predicted protein [Octopus vulgaris]